MDKPNTNELKKGPWTREEDQKLLAYIEEHGHGSWRSLPAKAGLERCGKSCRLRWTNYLRPDIKRGKFSTQEEKSIIRLHALLGNRWSAISTHLPNRTDNEIKNYWNTRLKKRLVRMGIDPTTHKPKNNLGSSKQAADISHMAQWETARLEAEARLVRKSKLLNLNLLRRASTCPTPPPPPPCLDVLKAWQATSTSNNFFLPTTYNTLNLISSNNSTTVSTIGLYGSSFMASDVMPVKGKMDNPVQIRDNNYVVDDSDYGHSSAHLSDFVSEDGFNMNNSGIVGESEEDIRNYWTELLNMVSSDNLTFA